MPALSILICHLPARVEYLARLSRILEPQLTPAVEVLVDDTEGVTIGQKRNQLLARARGEYVAYVDDDDRVADDYVERILAALRRSPDGVGFIGEITTNGEHPTPFHHTTRYPEYPDWITRDGIYWRGLNHLNPVRTTLARTAVFPFANYGEDNSYANEIAPLIEREVFLPAPPIYFYDYRSDK